MGGLKVADVHTVTAIMQGDLSKCHLTPTTLQENVGLGDRQATEDIL